MLLIVALAFLCLVALANGVLALINPQSTAIEIIVEGIAALCAAFILYALNMEYIRILT